MLEHVFDDVIARFDELFQRRHPSTTPRSAELVEQIGMAARLENRAAMSDMDPKNVDAAVVGLTEPSPSAAVPILQLVDVSKRFPGVVALDNVSFDLYPGEVHVLVGENGAGKSTLVKLLSGIYQPDEGQILIDGQPVHLRNPHAAQQPTR